MYILAHLSHILRDLGRPDPTHSSNQGKLRKGTRKEVKLQQTTVFDLNEKKKREYRNNQVRRLERAVAVVVKVPNGFASVVW